MTIYYLDPVNGNDAAAGISWATAWKTFTSGPTAARIAPGDEVRIAKSPDPTTVGTATWTNRKIGNSITFDTAPTKQIDKMKSGWVTMGAATVTNNQSTAYMMWDTTPGTGSALSVAASTATSLAYKNLGAVTDFSAHQQISFWFRPVSAFDCSGAQNMFIRLCSDTAGTTVVNTLTMPKWSYAANTWYPIVIDAGSALGSNIQSVSITVTSSTASNTFYFDEMFASPAGGLTLWSLIEDNDSTWYGIRTIRDADVWLLSSYAPTTATGASTTITFLDAAWVGTTANFSTRKRETFKAHGTTGPANTTWCTNNEAGTWTGATKLLNQYRFGFNTTTDTQDGYTFADNLTGLGTGLTSSTANWRYERFIGVKWASPFTINAISEFDKNGAVCSGNISIGSFISSTVLPTYNKTFEFLFVTGGASPSGSQSLGFGSTSVGAMNFNITFGNVWGICGWAVSGIHGSELTFKNLIHSGSTGANSLQLTTTSYNKISVSKIETTVSYGFTGGTSSPNLLYLSSSSKNYIKINSMFSGGGISLSSSADIVDLGEYAGISSLIGVATAANDDFVIRCVSNNSSSALKWFSGIGVGPNGKIYVQDFNGTGTAAVFTGVGNTTGSIAPSYFELQTGDIHTSGSKAWKYNGQGFADYFLGANDYLKLASVAAEANKLVTITCYVKNITSYQDVYIAVPAIFLPGYTSDIKTSFTGTPGSWQQLTITFTPTADCVFDVIGGVFYNSTVADTNAVWDDLVVTQAA